MSLKLNIPEDKLIYFPNWAEDLYSKTDLEGNPLLNEIMPKDKFIVITGLSGSGKSSLAFDTIYAEGQRR